MPYQTKQMNSARDEVENQARIPNFAFGPYTPNGRAVMDKVNEVTGFIGRVISGEEDNPPGENEQVKALNEYEHFISATKSQKPEGSKALTAHLKAIRAMLKAGPNATVSPSGKPTEGETDVTGDVTGETVKPKKKVVVKKRARKAASILLAVASVFAFSVFTKAQEPYVEIVNLRTAEEIFDLLSRGETLTLAQVERLFNPRQVGPKTVILLRHGITMGPNADTNELRGALAHALGRPSSEVRFCTADEMRKHELDDLGRWVILPAGQHCRRPLTHK